MMEFGEVELGLEVAKMAFWIEKKGKSISLIECIKLFFLWLGLIKLPSYFPRQKSKDQLLFSSEFPDTELY